MASRLVRLKAQMLLPRRSEEDGWEDPRAELVRRLLEYQQIREIAVWMGRAGRAPGGAVRPRLSPAAAGAAAAAADARSARDAPGGRPGGRGASPRRCCTASWRGRSTSKAPPGGSSSCSRSASEFGWLDALGPRPTIVDVLSTLLALLELAKRGTLRLVQPAAFAPMVIARDPARPAA